MAFRPVPSIDHLEVPLLNAVPYDTFANIPATPWPYSGALWADLTPYLSARFAAWHDANLGPAGSVLALYYTVDLTGAAGWAPLAGLTIDLAAPLGYKRTAAVDVPAAARTQVLLQLWTDNGNGTSDPRLSSAQAEFQAVPA